MIEGNIIEKLTSTMASVNAEGNNESLLAMKQSLISELTNATKAFSDIPAFVDHIVASAITLVIKRLARGKGKIGEAYKIGDN
jgi:hypothetical protein